MASTPYGLKCIAIGIDFFGCSIGLPPRGKYHIDVDPTKLCLKNQSVKGTLSGSFADCSETLAFAQRGKY